MNTNEQPEQTTRIERAIAYRVRMIEAERKSMQHFRSNEIECAAEMRATSEIMITNWQRQIEALRALPASASEDQIWQAAT